MTSFLLGVLVLILGYFLYGTLVERIFGLRRDRPTPAYSEGDRVDFVPMPRWRNSLIQLLNIAGVGPIFGPILGALYGPVAFLWIALGTVFAGAVHDFLIGMISVRNRGYHLPLLAGQFLGRPAKHVVNAFAVLLLLLVGTVFVLAPSMLLYDMMNESMALHAIVIVIFAYYLGATMLPIDKLIGRVYPFFGLLLLISAASIFAMLVLTRAPIPNVSLASFATWHPEGLPIFPMLFITISCGALSGFHATQSPIIARTLEREEQGRSVFYGMMIVEGIIAMIWAAAAMALVESGRLEGVLALSGPAGAVRLISIDFLGPILGTIAILGVIVLPITSGDTAFRSLRMMIGDYLHVPQRPVMNRLVVALPLFCLSIALTYTDFSVLWRYFTWANQTLASVALWTAVAWLLQSRKPIWIALLPAVFITSVALSYILHVPIGFGLSLPLAQVLGVALSLCLGIAAWKWSRTPSV